MSKNAPPTHAPASMAGMSLIEMGVVILIIGLILSLGVFSMQHMMENARVTRARATLQQVKDCLLKRAVFNDRYPTHDGSVNCNDLTFDVNACMCRDQEISDAWGTQLRYVEGIDGSGNALGWQAILDNGTPPGAASAIVNEQGDQESDVAFLIVSDGENRTADNAGYAGATIQSLDPGAQPDFSGADNDDIYLMVTAGELRAAIAE